MEFKAAIFDMDGTLLDSMALWDNLGKLFLEREGVTGEFDNPGLSLRRVSRAVSEQFPIFSEEYVYISLHEIIREFYKTLAPLKPFVSEYLAKLRQEGIPLCLATVTDRIHAENVLRRHGIHKYFDFIITVPEFGKTKETPGIYLHCAERLGVSPAECAVFEDAYYAVKSAKSGGFRVFAIDDEYARGNAEKIRALADRYIISYSELL